MAKGDYEPGKVGGDYEKGINRGEGPAPAPKGGERDAGLSTEPIDFADDGRLDEEESGAPRMRPRRSVIEPSPFSLGSIVAKLLLAGGAVVGGYFGYQAIFGDTEAEALIAELREAGYEGEQVTLTHNYAQSFPGTVRPVEGTITEKVTRWEVGDFEVVYSPGTSKGELTIPPRLRIRRTASPFVDYLDIGLDGIDYDWFRFSEGSIFYFPNTEESPLPVFDQDKIGKDPGIINLLGKL